MQRPTSITQLAVRCSTAILLALFLLAVPLAANAQFSNGAVIVTVPSTGSEPTTKPAIKSPPKRKPSTQKRAKPRKSTRRAANTQKRRARNQRKRSTAADKLKIAVLVNDDPITQYEVTQRAALLAGSAGLGKRAQANFQRLIKRPSTNARLKAILKETIEANRGRSREQVLSIFEKRKQVYARSIQRQAVESARKSVLPGLKRKATEELIDERLKLQAAKQAKALVPKSELDKVMRNIAKRNKRTLAQFKKELKQQGTDIYAMRSRVRAQLSWMRLVNAKFGRFVDVNQKTIDESVIGGSDAEKVSLHLHRLVFKLPSKITQQAITKRIVEAERVRAAFTGCTATRQLTRGTRDVTFTDMGYQVAAAVAEPTRSQLLNSRDGEMSPPVTTRDGVALYAVCARRAGTKSFAARAAAERTLRRKHTEIYGRKYLSDLRREAHIEHRIR